MASCSGPSTQGSCVRVPLAAWSRSMGWKAASIEPLGEQVGRGRAGEAADVGAGEREAAEAEVEQLRRGHAQVVPGGGVVAGPGGGVALAAGVAGAGQDEGAHVRARA